MCRSPALTCLHLSASKFSEAISGGITTFLRGDVAATQSLFTSTQPPVKMEAMPKKAGIIQVLFQKAAEKKKKETEDEPRDDELGEFTPSNSNSLFHISESTTSTVNQQATSAVACSSGISSFFQRKTLGKNSNGPFIDDHVKESTENLCQIDTLQETSCDDVLITPGLQQDSTDFLNSSLPEYITNEDLLKCETCGQDVLVWEMPEHNDYHYALNLQNSFSSLTSSSSSVSVSPETMQSSRGKNSSRRQVGPQAKRARLMGSNIKLDSFFKKT